jgi:hypothetical protein
MRSCRALGEWWGDGFAAGVAQEVESSKDEHLQDASGDHHGGAADGEVQTAREVAGDDEEGRTLHAHPTGGGAEVGEDAVVDGGDDDEQQHEPVVLRAERAYKGGGGDAEGEQSHAEQRGGEGFVKDGEADGESCASRDGSSAGVAGALAEGESEDDGEDGSEACEGRAFDPREEGGVGRDGEEVQQVPCRIDARRVLQRLGEAMSGVDFAQLRAIDGHFRRT